MSYNKYKVGDKFKCWTIIDDKPRRIFTGNKSISNESYFICISDCGIVKYINRNYFQQFKNKDKSNYSCVSCRDQYIIYIDKTKKYDIPEASEKIKISNEKVRLTK